MTGMRKIPIEITENKFLRLHNVLHRDLFSIEKDYLESVFRDMNILANACGFVLKGPSVIRNYIDDDSNERKYELLIQCNGSISGKIRPDMKVVDELRIGPCLYARFVGHEEDFFHTIEKISVYSYENDIELTGETYTVTVCGDGSNMTIDIFCPEKEGGQ